MCRCKLSSPYIKKQDDPHGLPCKSKGRASEDALPVVHNNPPNHAPAAWPSVPLPRPGERGSGAWRKTAPGFLSWNDMYPQFWTPRIGGIFMKYSYEYKKNCIELYRQGKWPETPDGIKQENFRISVRRWSRREKSCGAESLQKNQKKMWSADEKYELIAKVLAGVSITESAISAGVEPSLLSQWVRCYKMKGYQGLAAQRKGRPPKEPDMKKKIVPAELTPSEREELIRLRAENEYLRTENEVIKKRIALRQEKFAAQLKAKKLHSSTNSEEKDTL